MCSTFITRKIILSNRTLNLIRPIHTSQPRQVIDVLAAVSAGHFFQSCWSNIDFYYKCSAVALPVVSTGYLTTYCLLRYKFDSLLNRKKLAFSPTFGYKDSLTKKPKLAGSSVEKVNQLLDEIIKANSSLYALQHPSYFWQTIIFENPGDWYDLNEAGQMFISKDILLRLTKQELIALMSIQIAHVLAKHKTEITSYSIASSYYLSIIAGFYTFFTPRLTTYLGDMATLVILHQIIGYFITQMKFRSLLVEADNLGLKMARNCQVNEEHFISLFEKLIEARKTLSFADKGISFCFYDYRIKKMKSYLK